MSTHDVLAFAIAGEAITRIRASDPLWSPVFSANVYPSSSRNWPLPDFVIVDGTSNVMAAVEFKPPNQSKREYLTGLGQAIAYTRDFHYGILVVPDVADDDYRIADHIASITSQDVLASAPIGLLRYDPRQLSSGSAAFDVVRPLTVRQVAPASPARVSESFWAKWREMSADEIGAFLEHLYEEGRRSGSGTVRDRAFMRLWADIQAGRLKNWSGGVRTIADTTTNYNGFAKNYRNFVHHLGWCTNDGKLTESGLKALQVVHQYGASSRVFVDHLAQSVLTDGKHLVLINAINEFQDTQTMYTSENAWLSSIESTLEDRGLLKRNPMRGAAATQGSPRGFLKAEKTLWKNLGLIIPRGPSGGRVYHPNRGFIFNWSRITSLLS